MNNIVYLDTDFINKTFSTKNNSSTLLDEILKLPYEFRITRKVLAEITFNQVLSYINKKIINREIVLVNNLEIANELKPLLDDKSIENIILQELKEINEIIFEDDGVYYLSTYSLLENMYLMNVPLDGFLDSLDNIINSIAPKQNIGEIVTILNMSLANRLLDTKVISLLSHDASARRCILHMPENSRSYDCFSCFHLLKEIMPIEEAKIYIKSWKKENPKNITVKINKNNASKGVDISEFIKIIYEKQYKVLRNGIVSI